MINQLSEKEDEDGSVYLSSARVSTEAPPLLFSALNMSAMRPVDHRDEQTSSTLIHLRLFIDEPR